LQAAKEQVVRRHRSGITGWAVIAAAVVLPVAVSVYRRGRLADYTRSPEFRAIVGDFLI
jgi:hypothetical protein